MITFIDLAGHEKYLKTTVFGMTGHAPDFGMLMVGANAGIIGMTKEHLGLALALRKQKNSFKDTYVTHFFQARHPVADSCLLPFAFCLLPLASCLLPLAMTKNDKK